MKTAKYLLIVVLAILIAGSAAEAQQATTTTAKDFKFSVKTNPLSALGGPLVVMWIVPITAEYKVIFEAQTLKKQSIQVGLGYLGTSPLIKAMSDLGGDTAIVSRGFRGQLWYKFFLTSDDAPAGFYIGPHVSYATAKVKNNQIADEYIKASKLNVNVVLGYQVISKGGFALDVFTGLGLKNKTFSTSDASMDKTLGDLEMTNKTTIGVPLGFSFGYAF
jgi:hypothetical protein